MIYVYPSDLSLIRAESSHQRSMSAANMTAADKYVLMPFPVGSVPSLVLWGVCPHSVVLSKDGGFSTHHLAWYVDWGCGSHVVLFHVSCSQVLLYFDTVELGLVYLFFFLLMNTETCWINLYYFEIEGFAMVISSNWCFELKGQWVFQSLLQSLC